MFEDVQCFAARGKCLSSRAYQDRRLSGIIVSTNEKVAGFVRRFLRIMIKNWEAAYTYTMESL